MMNNRYGVFALALIVGAPLFIFSARETSAATISERLAGRIVLQVEQKGKAWYIEPSSRTRAYLGRPSDAFRVMRELGVGITNTDLERIATADEDVMRDSRLARRLAGKILLQVEAHGEAWYVNPVDLKRYFLGKPADAFRVMRELGLGVRTSDLDAIPGNESFADPEQPFVSVKKSDKKAGGIDQEYSSAEAGIRFSFPKDWKKIDTADLVDDYPDNVVQIYLEKEKHFVMVNIFRTEDDQPLQTSEQVKNEWIATSKDQKRFIKSYPTTIGGASVEGLINFEENDTGESQDLRLLIPRDGAYYEIVYSVLPQELNKETSSRKVLSRLFNQYLPDITKIVASVRFSLPREEPTTAYRNNDYGISLSYPKERWVRDETDDGTDEGSSVYITTLNSPTGSLYMRMIKDNRGSVENYYEYALSVYEAAEYTILSSGPIAHSAGEAYQIEYSLYDKNGFYTYIADNDTLYELHYSALNTGYNRYLNQSKRAIKSFRFIEPAYTLDTSYEDKKSGARFFYPSEWKVQPADYVNDIIVGSSVHSAFVGYSGGFEPTGSPTTLEQYAKDSIERFTLAGYTDIRQSSAMMGGLPATRISGVTADNQRHVSVMTLRGGKGNYFILIAPDEATRDRFLPVFEQIVSSFSFTSN